MSNEKLYTSPKWAKILYFEVVWNVIDVFIVILSFPDRNKYLYADKFYLQVFRLKVQLRFQREKTTLENQPLRIRRKTTIREPALFSTYLWYCGAKDT